MITITHRRTIHSLVALVALFGVMAMTSPAQAGGNSGKAYQSATEKPAAAQADIVDTAISAGSFTTLVTAVQAAGLVETLKGEGPFTVFAPTDEAFAKLPAGTLDDLLADKEKLAQILTYHVVPGRLEASEVLKTAQLQTVEGSMLTVGKSSGSAMVDSAKIVQTDIVTTNGVIHVIDTVVIPK